MKTKIYRFWVRGVDTNYFDSFIYDLKFSPKSTNLRSFGNIGTTFKI